MISQPLMLSSLFYLKYIHIAFKKHWKKFVISQNIPKFVIQFKF